ncbi:glycosyltransferase family 2 protein [Actinotalea sp. Marseille-Q4924]|uniref:glycosyltransferase family 2 protein n=1 Tax=Actinotalea sp. Marseille-Q4924 TaxID=2866571 RepID=UPI001CE3F0D0|nr:glycosyltransferase family 2 protein [Actinotalea sp. Marseille-Q4924]
MVPSRMTAAVVVCAYTNDRWDEMSAALRTAATQEPAPDELLLVVDHNPDLWRRAMEELRPGLPVLEVVENSRRKGLSGARNTALLAVSSDVVVFLDDDAAAEPGWLGRLLAHYDDDAVLAVGGSAVPEWPPGQGRPVTLPCPPGATRGELDWVVGCTYRGQPEAAAPVRNLMGCNMSFRRSVLARVGGFAESLGRVGRTPLGCEETELCIRARNAYPGHSIVFEPRAVVHHSVSVDRLTWAYLRRRCFAEGLSKAAVAVLQGQEQALDTERRYASRVIPSGLIRELTAAVRPAHSARSRHLQGAAALVLGLAVTTLGYLRGSVALRVGAGGGALVRESHDRLELRGT